jgi:hypothetical protein
MMQCANLPILPISYLPGPAALCTSVDAEQQQTPTKSSANKNTQRQ